VQLHIREPYNDREYGFSDVQCTSSPRCLNPLARRASASLIQNPLPSGQYSEKRLASRVETVASSLTICGSCRYDAGVVGSGKTEVYS